MKLLKDILMFVLVSIAIEGVAQTVPVSVAGTLNITNSILDNDQKYNQFGPSVVLSYSAVRGDVVPPGVGNQAILGTTEYKDHVALPPEEFSYFLSPVSTFRNAGNPTLPPGVPDSDINGNPRLYNGRIDIGAVEYSLIFNRGNGSWNNIHRWNIGRIPTEYDVVTILDETTVSVPDAVCKSMIQIGDHGKVLIESAAQLDVKTFITNSDANKIVIKASAEHPNGTLIFQNPVSSPVSATVEMYSMAFVDEELEDDDPAKFNWQYFGIPVRSLVAVPSFDGAWVRKWNEASNAYDKWEELTNHDVLTSFRGYEIVQPNEKTYTFKGVLENRDTTIVLNKSAVPYYAGQHVLSNPYTASVSISEMSFGGNAEATVYVYNSGSYADWNADANNGRLGSGRGQYLAVPQNVAGMILPEIPSMQGFIVRVTEGNGSVSIPYAAATRNTGKQRAKRVYQNPHLVVELFGHRSYDRAWLLYEPTASRNFDNGWDGYKIRKNDSSAMIYSVEPAGDLQVNTVDDFNHINLHFVPGKDEEYTLKIVNHNMNEVYSYVYLVDLKENKVVEIQGDTTSYSFLASNPDAPRNRFKIMTTLALSEDDDGDSKIKIYHQDNHVLIDNQTEENGYYTFYDMSGRLLIKEPMNTGLTSVFVEHITGVLILRLQAGDERKTEKILIRN